MRKEKEIRIDDKIYIVYEIRPKDLIDTYAKVKEGGEVKNILAGELLPLLSNIPMSEIEKMYPGDIEIAVEALKEVNSSFLKPLRGIMQNPEVKKIIQEMGKSLLSEFSGAFASSYKQVTEDLKNTAGASS